MLLFLLRCCCRQRHHRQYNINRKSLRERLFGSDGAKDQRTIYATNDLCFPTATSSLYVMNANNDSYSSRRSNITAEAIETDNELHPDTIVFDSTMSDSTEHTECHLRKNYYVQEKPSYDEYHMKHNQDIQILPGPTITIINMAIERMTDDPNWEEANPFERQYDYTLSSPTDNRSLQIKQASARYTINDSPLLQNNPKYEPQPNIYTHQFPIQAPDKYLFNQNKKAINHKLKSNFHPTSGNNSASICKRIHIFTPKKQSSASWDNEDEYKTAGADDIEIEIKDHIRLQKAKNIISVLPQEKTNRIKLRQIEQQLEDNAFLY